MKKLFVFFILVALFSCSKDDTYCWVCNKEIRGPEYYLSVMLTVCGMTYDERSDFEKSNTTDTGLWKQTMNCKIKD